MRANVMDMTQGAIMPKLVRFALPVLLGMLFQRIYNFADVYIVGRFLGDEALAAVSISGAAMYLLFSIMMGLTTGVSVVISQFYGAGDENKIRETFATSIYVAGIMTLIVTAMRIRTWSSSLPVRSARCSITGFPRCCAPWAIRWCRWRS